MTTEKQIAALERLINDSCQPEKVRRACSLRLSRLRRAGASTPQRMGAAPLAKSAPPLPVPTEKQCVEAAESFYALSRQRSALHRKRRTPAEQNIFASMLSLMPGAVPTTDDPTAWRNFISQVEGVLAEIKNTTI